VAVRCPFFDLVEASPVEGGVAAQLAAWRHKHPRQYQLPTDILFDRLRNFLRTP